MIITFITTACIVAAAILLLATVAYAAYWAVMLVVGLLALPWMKNSRPGEERAPQAQASGQKATAMPEPKKTELNAEKYSPNNRVEWFCQEAGVYQVKIANSRTGWQKTLSGTDIERLERDVEDLFLRWSIKEKSLG